MNEVAKKIVSTSPSTPVAVRMSSADAKASLVSRSASPRMPSRCVSVEMIDVADVLGDERGDDDHGREERDERLRREGDAAIDELDLEHALPHPPEQQALEPGPCARDPSLQPPAVPSAGAVMSCRRRSGSSGFRGRHRTIIEHTALDCRHAERVNAATNHVICVMQPSARPSIIEASR